MKVLNVDKLLLVCYSAQTTVVSVLDFSEDLWQTIWEVTLELYGAVKPVKPSRLLESVKTLREQVSSFVKNNTKVLCEVPSVTAIACQHDATEEIGCFGCHPSRQASVDKSFAEFGLIVHKAKDAIETAYRLSRNMAKQVLVVMISDVDRCFKAEIPHAAPVAYALTGYSITSEQMSNIMREVRLQCQQRRLNIVAECFDGAFAKIATRDKDGKPLTLLQLSKDVWNDSKKTQKNEQIKQIANSGVVQTKNVADVIQQVDARVQMEQLSDKIVFLSPVVLGLPKTITSYKYFRLNMKTLLKDASKQKKSENVENSEEERAESIESMINDISDAVQSAKDDAIPDHNVLEVCTEIMMQTAEDNNKTNENEALDTIHSERTLSNTVMEDLMEVDQNTVKLDLLPSDWRNMLDELKSSDKLPKGRKKHIDDMEVENFQNCFRTAAVMDRSFTKNELLTCIVPIQHYLDSVGVKIKKSLSKVDLVNILDKHIGLDGEKLVRKPKSFKVKSLKQLCKQSIQKYPKSVLNVVYAHYKYPSALLDWKSNQHFSDEVKVFETNNPVYWYSQPEYINDEMSYILRFLDPEHILTNLRTKVCKDGLKDLQISPNAWLTVAKRAKENGAGLTLPLVEDLVDKQNCEYAKTTFSSKVECALENYGFKQEANFCRLIRNWHRAQDEAGLSALDRHLFDIEIRDFLLNGVTFDNFPPPGKYVKSIPVTTFEGILVHIDRRMQLYSLVEKGTYNVRSLGTLDNENFFGAFQDYDPKGTGVLRVEEVGLAMSTACSLYHERLNPDRGFYLATSKKRRVYPVKEVPSYETTLSPGCPWIPPCPKYMTSICLRDHEFDKPDRAGCKPKRKRGTISSLDDPARGMTSLRSERYKTNEAKILPRKRESIELPSLLF